jgi:hypothetical protein
MKPATYCSFNVKLVKQKWTVAVHHSAKKFIICPMKPKKRCAKVRAIATIFLIKAAQITFLLKKILGTFLILQTKTLPEN